MSQLATKKYSTMKRPALGIFIVASVLLHAGLLTISIAPTPITPALDISAPLNVTLERTFSDTSSAAQNAAHATSQPHLRTQNSAPRPQHPTHTTARTTKHVQSEKQKRDATSAVAQLPKLDASVDESPNPSQPSVPSDAMASATAEPIAHRTKDPTIEAPLTIIAREIVSLMEAFRRFPPLARQRGWEGEVLLSFRLNERGVIDNIQVAHGSGFPVLDQNAVDTLRRVGNIERSAPWLPHSTVDVSLPVVYALTEG